MTSQTTTQLDHDRIMAFVFRAVDEVGATLNAALVVLGDKLGYYRAMMESFWSTLQRELLDRRSCPPEQNWARRCSSGSRRSTTAALQRYCLFVTRCRRSMEL